MQIKELTPKYAALAAASRPSSARARAPADEHDELGYGVDAANLLEVCRDAAR